MKARFLLPTLSLRVKLILSYLGVALGAVILLAIVLSFAVRNYFDQSQRDLLRTRAEYQAQYIERVYDVAGGWNNITVRNDPTRDPVLFVLVDTSGKQIYFAQPTDLPLSSDDLATVQQALNGALKGQEVQGYLHGSNQSNFFSGFYISVPLWENGTANGQLIGAILIAEPHLYPRGFSADEFLVNVNQAILLTGFIVALVVILFSFFLARRLTRPLNQLTLAAEQMKQGDYAQRVKEPRSMDEMGRLALTFNAMANTIEMDVTELRKQEQLRRDLIANIAHDLATPLTSIQGLSEALADEIILVPEARQQTAQLIGREVQRLRRLVAEMQQMTSLESGRTQLELAPLDLQALVDETVAVIAPECEQAGITLENQIAPTTPLALADSDRITQVLLNLLDNARRHTPEGGSITVSAQTKDNKLVITVKDTGTGIDPANLPHIFERFYRADRSRSGSTGGSGLGLSIVKALIAAHGGTIYAESTLGQGTLIHFTLPLAPANA